MHGCRSYMTRQSVNIKLMHTETLIVCLIPNEYIKHESLFVCLFVLKKCPYFFIGAFQIWHRGPDTFQNNA